MPAAIRCRVLAPSKALCRPTVSTTKRTRTLTETAARPKPAVRKVGPQSCLATLARGTLLLGDAPPTSSGEASSESESEAAGPRRVRVLRRRARVRLYHYLRKSLEQKAVHGTTLLESRAVTRRVERQYHQELERFGASDLGRDWKDMGDATLDEALAGYLERLYFEGHTPSRGMKLLAALMHVKARFAKGGGGRIPRAWRAIKGWKKLCPGSSRPPEPMCVWAAMAHELVSMGQVDMATFLLLGLSTYARPSALLRLCPEHMVKPTRTCRFWALLLDPLEKGAPSKVGEFDTSVVLDHGWINQLDQKFHEMSGRVRGESVWSFDYDTYSAMFREASLKLGLSLVPYQTRHSGPSLDRACGFRGLPEVKSRGGWRADSSVARYEKHARLGFSEQEKDPRLVKHGEACTTLLADAILLRRALLRPVGLEVRVPAGSC